ELTTSMAHELNQPLSAISADGGACLSWLGREVPAIDEARSAAERIIENAIRAGDVIKAIRALVRKSAPETAPLNINEVIYQVIALTASELKRNGVMLQTELQRDIPPVLGDRVQMEQVLLNLMLNSNEAMSAVDSVRE